MKPSTRENTSTSLAPPLRRSVSRQQSRQVSPSNEGIRPRNNRIESFNSDTIRTNTASTSESSRAGSVVQLNRHSRYGDATQPPRTGLSHYDEVSNKSLIPDRRKKSLWDGAWASFGLNSLQEIAFSMIADSSDSRHNRVSIHKKEDWFGRGTGRKATEWGPQGEISQQNHLRSGAGIIEAREDKVKEMKKTRILEGRDNENEMPDEAGNYKRRTSLEKTGLGSKEEDDFSLVYVHHVQPHDTIQGVVLKFHSRMDVFKKANRLWAGDSIQLRDKVFLPVETCEIKGKPCQSPALDTSGDSKCPASGLEKDTSYFNHHENLANGKSIENHGAKESPASNEGFPTHVRWVLLESSQIPVEVVRIPRKTLNYFPPRRRSLATLSTTSTSRISSDRPSIESQRNSSTQRTANTGHQSSQINTLSSLSRQSCVSERRESSSETSDRRGWLQGPGGVGTLGKNERKPGPANDALNSWTRKKFPSIAIDTLPSTSTVCIESANLSLDSGDTGPMITDGNLKPPAPMNGNSALIFPNVNLNGVESWVRKIATKVQVPRNLREDAIEMLDGVGSDDGRTFDSSAGRSSATTSRLGFNEESFETSVRGRRKNRKSEKKE